MIFRAGIVVIAILIRIAFACRSIIDASVIGFITRILSTAKRIAAIFRRTCANARLAGFAFGAEEPVVTACSFIDRLPHASARLGIADAGIALVAQIRTIHGTSIRALTV